jgi:hypothetical protein
MDSKGKVVGGRNLLVGPLSWKGTSAETGARRFFTIAVTPSIT